MKKSLLAAIGVAAVSSIFLLPGFAQKTINSTNTSEPSSGADRAFLKKAIEGSEAEIELGKLAQEKSQNPMVKEFATTIVKDHSDALNRLRQAQSSIESSGNVEDTAGVTLSKQHQALKDRLAKLSGNEFDREYIKAMVKEHQKDIGDFEAEANSLRSAGASGREKPVPEGTEAQPQALARDLLPTLRMHLEQAQSLQRQMGGQ